MSAIVPMDRTRILIIATTTVLLIPIVTSCVPESTPPAAGNQEGIQGTSLQPASSAEEPAPAMKVALRGPSAPASSPGPLPSTKPAIVSEKQQTPVALETPDGVLVGRRPAPVSNEEAQAPKESAMSQITNPTSAQGDSPTSRFFPIPDGAIWRYQLRILDGNGETLGEATVERRVEGTKAIDGREYARLTTTTLSGTNTRAPDQHYRVTEQGIVAAVDGVAGKELLVLPNDPASKQSWSGEAPPVIKSVNASVSVGEQVACGEGVINDCVRVDMDFVMRGAGLFAPSEVPVRIQRWFASGIGMVRERRIAGGRTIEAVLEKTQL